MSTNCLFKAVCVLLFLTVVVDSICWNCMSENLSEEEIDRILAEDFEKRIMKKLGLAEEPVVTENQTALPLEIVNELVADDEEDIQQDDDHGLLKSVILESLNNESAISNTASFFEYKSKDRLEKYRIQHVTLWLHVNADTSLYEVYEKFSTLPRRMVFMDKYQDNVSKWKKITFVPSQVWMRNPLKKIRIEIEGVETPITEKPLLQIDVQRKKMRLKKRHAQAASPTKVYPTGTITDDCNPNRKSLCCKHSRHLPFLPSVLSSQNYLTYTCSGRCDPKHRNNDTWTYLSAVTAPRREPCCVPTSFEPITLIVRKNGGYQTLVLDDFKVKTCGCA